MSGYQAKTCETEASVSAYLDTIDDEQRKSDCEILLKMMRDVTGKPAKMWGTRIVGFGSYHYRYASGHQGDSCLVGFSSRKNDISIYIMSGFEEREVLLAQLGKHKTGKACLYVRRLSDIAQPVLMELIEKSVMYVKSWHPLA